MVFIARKEENNAHRKRPQVIGRALIVSLALLACALPPVLVNDAIGYLPIMVVLLAILLAFCYLQVLKRSLEFTEDSLLSSCERGDEVEFVVRFKNRSPLVFGRLEVHFYISDLFGDIDASFPTTTVLLPFEERDFSFGATFDHIGTYQAGVSKIVIADLLGLFSHTAEHASNHSVDVLPRLFDVSNVELTNVTAQETKTSFKPLVDEGMDFSGVRDYQWGDPLKTIHWKLSAAKTDGGYLTRLFEQSTNPGLTVILDTSAPSYGTDDLMHLFDGLVESALSVNEYAHDHHMESRIAFIDGNGVRIQTDVKNTGAYRDLTDKLRRIHVGDGTAEVDMLAGEARSIHGQGNVAFCTAHANENVVSALIDVKNSQRNPLLFLVVPPSLEERERRELLLPLRRLDASRIVYYVVSSAEQLSGSEVRA